jgi:hypothetical protein
MIIKQAEQTLQTNMKTQSTSFGIGDVSTIIDILRNRLYSNPIQTLVQEYICNARDAMREAGNWGKKELVIGVPNAIKPTFSVRDYGVGLSPERVQKVFVLYGASTKRDSNNQTGGFGIGAKSAWSYTDSFTVTTFVDGVKRIYVAHLGHNNVGSFDMISETKTDEANGTMVEVAVKSADITTFSKAIQRCVCLWKEPIKLLGTTESFSYPVKYEDDNLLILDIKNSYRATNTFDNYSTYLAIDGVIYQWNKSDSYLSNLSSDYIYLYKFKTGEIEVSASREEVTNSDDNKEKIKQKINQVHKMVDGLIEDMKKCKTIEEVISFHKENIWSRKVTDTSVDLGDYSYINGYISFKNKTFFTYTVKGGRKKTVVRSEGRSFRLGNSILIQDGKLKQMDWQRRVKSFVFGKKDEVALFDSLPSCLANEDHTLVSDLPFIPAPVKLQKNSVSAEHVSIDTNDKWGSFAPVTNPLDTSKKYCYTLKKSFSSDERNFARILGYTLLRVTLIGEKQVKKQIPNIKTVKDVIEEYITSNLDNIFKIQKKDGTYNLLSMSEFNNDFADFLLNKDDDKLIVARQFISRSDELYKKSINVRDEICKIINKKYSLISRIIHLNQIHSASVPSNVINELRYYVACKNKEALCQ